MITNSRRAMGLSLVELLVAMLIAAFIFSGVVSIAMTSSQTFKDERESSFIQENARYALDVLSRDVRIAGSLGCVDTDRVKLADTVNPGSFGASGEGLYSLAAINGYDASESMPAVLEDVSDGSSDAIILRYAEPETEQFVSSHSRSSLVFQMPEAHGYKLNENLVVVDASCRHAGVFRASHVDDTTLGHENNCGGEIYSDGLLGLSSCASLLAEKKYRMYQPGSSIMQYISHAYYVAESSVLPGVPALKRRSLSASGFVTDELAQGVESLHFQYGVDLDGEVVGDVDTFLEANVINNSPQLSWDRVSAVRISIVFRSQSQILSASQEPSGDDGDENQNIDGYLRKAVATTVQMRNRYRVAEESL